MPVAFTDVLDNMCRFTGALNVDDYKHNLDLSVTLLTLMCLKVHGMV